MQIIINLTPEESAALRAKSVETQLSPEFLVHSFIRDLTGAMGNGGSDERDFAEAWYNRHFAPFPELTDRQRREKEQLQSEAYAHGQTALQEWRARHQLKA